MLMTKVVPMMMAAMMLSTPAAAVTAQAAPSDTDTHFNVGYEEASKGATRDTEVTYHEDASFTVTIPKSITLGSAKDATYDVKVTGSITGDKKVVVAPHDDVDATEGINFLMQDQNTGLKKADVPATVTQAVTDWSATEMDTAGAAGVTKNGSILASGLTAGTWKGDMTFDISLANAQ